MNILSHFKNLKVILFVFLTQASFSQNLISNGDFENLITCPDDDGQIDYAENWINPTTGTPDLYNRCAGMGPCITCVPNYLNFGFQEPQSGDGYAGMYTIWRNSGSRYREYLQTELTTPLVAGQSYQFTIYLSFSDGAEAASNPPQVYFSEDQISMNGNEGFFMYDPQIEFDTLISDRENWVKLSACWMANGGEKYMTLGNFRDASETDILDLGPNAERHPYYLIDNLSLFPSDSPMVDLLPDTLVGCASDSIVIDLSDEYDVVWSDGFIGNERTIMRSGTFIITVNSDCIVDGTDTLVTRFDDRLDLSLPDSVFICERGDVTLQPGGEVDDWLWSDGSTSDSFVITQPGIYWVEATNECGTVRDSVFAERILDPTSDLPPDTVFCEGDSIWLTADPNLNPVWEGTVRSDSFLVRDAGTYILEVSNFCDLVTDIIIVRTLPPPEISLAAETTFCEGDSILAEVEVMADSWQWHDGSQDTARYITEEGWIWVEASSECGTKWDSLYIEELQEPVSSINDTSFCDGETLQISIPGQYEVMWSDGSMTNDYHISSSGVYVAEIYNDCGTIRDSIEVDVRPQPDLRVFSTDTSLCVGDSLVLRATSMNAPVIWDLLGTPGTSLEVDSAGIYMVSAENECGREEREVEVFVVNCGCEVYVPNVFSPNGDNINDELEVFAACPLENLKMSIYSRWGELIFESEAGQTFWDGRYHGELLQPGGYVYKVTYEIAGEKFVRSGSVTILR